MTLCVTYKLNNRKDHKSWLATKSCLQQAPLPLLLSFTFCLNLFSIVVVKHNDQKQFKRGKRLISPYSLQFFTEAKSRDERCLLACLSGSNSAAFLKQPRTTWPGVGSPLLGSSPPTSIINLKMFHTFACKESDGGIFFNYVPSSQITLAYVKLTKS